ncbi:MAG: SDR family oxidoreductase [Anaerolineae bacterium]|nr:SDR family oxidoreductase [Anaerolineae bacterium]
MDLQVQDKIILVTGGDSGMGFETAKVLANEGATIVLSDIDQQKLDASAQKLNGNVHTIAADLRKSGAAQELADLVQGRIGAVHSVAHFAGTSGASGDFLELSDEDWKETLEIDLMGAVRVARAFIPHMLENEWGRMLFVASENALQPYPQETPYNASKAAVTNLSKGLSKAYAEKGVLVNTISPAFVETPMTDKMMQKKSEELGVSVGEAVDWFLENKRPHIEVNRRGQPEEIAVIAALLCSPLSSYVNGANWRIDGGSVASI